MPRVAGVLFIVGLGCAASRGEVNLPEGFEIVEIDTSDYFTGFPAINNCGQIIFDKQLGDHFDDKEMFLYDNGGLKQLTDDDVADFVGDINDQGTAVWQREVRDGALTQVVLYQDGEISIFFDSEMGILSASINNLGHIAWSVWTDKESCKGDSDIMLWDGRRIRRISGNNGFLKQSEDMNDLGDVTWGRTDHCVNPWKGDIVLWSEGRRQILPSEFVSISVPTINDLRQVAWGSEGGIELWENGRTELLTDHGHVPELNNLGDMRFQRAIRGVVTEQWLYRVSEGKPRFYQLTDDKRENTSGDINDWGEVVWRYSRRRDFVGGWLFMRRIRTGDAQFDGSVDLDDHAAFADCMTGPGRVDRLCDCRFLDIDYDGDVDLGDFALFQNEFGGE